MMNLMKYPVRVALTLALPLANAAAAGESLQVSLQSTEARCARLRAACRALLDDMDDDAELLPGVFTAAHMDRT